MARRREGFPWIFLLVSLLPTGMILMLLCAFLVRDSWSGILPPRPCTAGPLTEDRSFRWVPPTPGISSLHPWCGWHLPQVRHGAWRGVSKRCPPPFGCWEGDVRLSFGQVNVAESDGWVDRSSPAFERELRARFEVEDRGPFHLDVRDQERWADVARLLAVAEQGLDDGEPWTLAVQIVPYRGFGVWSIVFAPPPSRGGPVLRLEATTSALGSGLDLHVGQEVFHFPEGNWSFGVLGRACSSGRLGALDAPDSMIEASNAVWPAAEAALAAAARGHESVTLSIDEEHGPVRWRTIVAVVDILLASDVETVSFTPGGFTLHFDVPRTPDPLDAWVPPQPLPTFVLILAALGGLLLALATGGLLRTSPSSR